jgi:hypothetical protein
VSTRDFRDAVSTRQQNEKRQFYHLPQRAVTAASQPRYARNNDECFRCKNECQIYAVQLRFAISKVFTDEPIFPLEEGILLSFRGFFVETILRQSIFFFMATV